MISMPTNYQKYESLQLDGHMHSKEKEGSIFVCHESTF